MEESKLELNASSLEEQGKVATSLEDIYGYKVLTETFQKQIDEYNKMREQERQHSLEYVFTRQPEDTTMRAFQTVMYAETSRIIGNEYEDKTTDRENPFVMAGFVVLGAVITGIILSLIEKRQKGKKKT